MSDRFHPISMEQLTGWAFTELRQHGSLFGIPRSAFFEPRETQPYRSRQYGHLLETPFGVAAGPHSQMAQNIVVAWACGARFIELKTVQTLDELEVNKPCIDLEDEGYNVEWSQELKVHESFDEYLRAWVLIHALHRELGFPGERPGAIFNMSVGYDLAGIRQPNVQWFLDAMSDCSAWKSAYVDIVAPWCPQVREIEIPDRISDSVTLSTMHGCPPGEIEKICSYLIAERRLHTNVKCNPTLLGAERVRRIVNDELGFADVPIPDRAFEHDLSWADAVPMLGNLRRQADQLDLVFGVKLTNTLEVDNFRRVFDRDETMYMSGRALHAVTVNLALAIAEELGGALPISFAGGADCFNVADLMRCGMKSVTVCSDLLKTGGYLRLLQYLEALDDAMAEVEAVDLEDFVGKSAAVGSSPEAADAGTAATATLLNLRRYAAASLGEPRSRKDALRTDRSKTTRRLELFDCIEAPCVDECPVDQKVPQYMAAVREGDLTRAVALAREDNPLPTILGRVCDHLCENTCIRTHLDEPLAIREMKRFIMSQEIDSATSEAGASSTDRVGIIGAGPAGLAAARELAQAGATVTIFEKHPYAGGMVGGAIPEYRLPEAAIDQDLRPLEALGVELRFGVTAGVDFTLQELRDEGFTSTFVAVGAQLARRLGLPGEEADGVLDALTFLRSVREGDPVPTGKRVGVIGAGDTAMDCVRSALRLGSEVTLIYRRTIDQMPADREEIRAAIEEGVRIVELAAPRALAVENGRLTGLGCTRMEYRGDRDAAGRKIPHPVTEGDFEIPLDTLILAISQDAILDFFGDRQPELTGRGYIQVDPVTLETSLPGVYAGGDAAADGPSSIVKAAADGKQVARSILGRGDLGGGDSGVAPIADSSMDDPELFELLARRARRQWRVPSTHTPLDQRQSFAETLLTYTPEQARGEAERCLDCHRVCSLCVGVCPNMALMTFRSEPVALALPTLRLAGGSLVVEGESRRGAAQSLQIAVLTDFCNECGNCTTFCPTAGEPYRDKPRVYLHRPDFLAERENAFMLTRENGTETIEGRFNGETHRLELDGEVRYASPRVSARLDPQDLSFIEALPGSALAADEVVRLGPLADLYVVLRGLSDSMPWLPRAQPLTTAGDGTRIGHPKYENPTTRSGG